MGHSATVTSDPQAVRGASRLFYPAWERSRTRLPKSSARADPADFESIDSGKPFLGMPPVSSCSSSGATKTAGTTASARSGAR